jgi:hypothetical protein
MANQKSKIPDMGEIASMAGKLFKDVKSSISEIIDDYKSKHPGDGCSAKPAKKAAPKSAASKPAKAKDTKSDTSK